MNSDNLVFLLWQDWDEPNKIKQPFVRKVFSSLEKADEYKKKLEVETNWNENSDFYFYVQCFKVV